MGAVVNSAADAVAVINGVMVSINATETSMAKKLFLLTFI
jgi:hypothetical protein